MRGSPVGIAAAGDRADDVDQVLDRKRHGLSAVRRSNRAATALQFQLPALGIDVPNALLIMLPYVLALLAVSGLIGRQTAPAYLTRAYRR